jgi:hypothetical protein
MFSFDTLSPSGALGGNSTLAIVAFGFAGFPAYLCVGGPTPIACGVNLASGAFTFFNIATTAFPHVTLVSTTVTPIPASLVLFGTALAGLGMLGAGARRRAQAA